MTPRTLRRKLQKKKKRKPCHGKCSKCGLVRCKYEVGTRAGVWSIIKTCRGVDGCGHIDYLEWTGISQQNWPKIDPRWKTSNVVDLANVIRKNSKFTICPILADALMDAGCNDERLILLLRNKRTMREVSKIRTVLTKLVAD